MNVAFNRLIVPCVALLAAGFASQASAEEYTKSYTVTGRATVHVRVDDSSVRVITSDSPQVEFHVKYEGFALGREPRIDSRQDGERVELTARLHPGITIGINTRHMSTEVRMPRNADLEIETGDGDVDASAINGNVLIRTGDGKLKVSQLAGKVDLQTGDGGISADTLNGDLRLRTGDGAIEATNLDGKCSVVSGDGSIRVAGRFDSLDVKSGDGGVTARVASGSRMASNWNIRTGDGPVEVALPKDFKANLDASTSDGHINLGLPVTVEGNFSSSRVRGAMNGGGASLFIHTGDGSIRLSAN
jgi:hypothetical protein